MLHFIFIPVCVLLNAICLWSIQILLKDKGTRTSKNHLKYLLGVPVGAGLSLLLSAVTVQNIIPSGMDFQAGEFLESRAGTPPFIETAEKNV